MNSGSGGTDFRKATNYLAIYQLKSDKDQIMESVAFKEVKTNDTGENLLDSVVDAFVFQQ